MQRTLASHYIRDLPDHSELNKAIKQQFWQQVDDPGTVRSHFFSGRYENIYLGLDKLPAMQMVMEQAKRFANEILDKPATLQAGFWFNSMAPGDTTTLHTHDDDDECLSGVYYIDVPDNSGNLILHEGAERIEVTPVAGRFVFFSPDLPHEVTENLSKSNRLSVGMNFGLKQS